MTGSSLPCRVGPMTAPGSRGLALVAAGLLAQVARPRDGLERLGSPLSLADDRRLVEARVAAND